MLLLTYTCAFRHKLRTKSIWLNWNKKRTTGNVLDLKQLQSLFLAVLSVAQELQDLTCFKELTGKDIGTGSQLQMTLNWTSEWHVGRPPAQLRPSKSSDEICKVCYYLATSHRQLTHIHRVRAALLRLSWCSASRLLVRYEHTLTD